MATTAPQSPITLPIARLAGVQCAAALIGAGVVAGASSPFVDGALVSASGAVASVVVGIAAAMVPLVLLGARPAAQWALPILLSGMIRMLVGVGLAAWLWLAWASIFGSEPHLLAYWGAFLASGLAALVAEALASIPIVGSDAPKRGERGRASAHAVG